MKPKTNRWPGPIRRGVDFVRNAWNASNAVKAFFDIQKKQQFSRINYANYLEDLYTADHATDQSDNCKKVVTRYNPVMISGRWKKYPWLHYCVFNRHLKIDNYESFLYADFDSTIPTVIFVTHETSRTGAPVLTYDLIKRFRKSHNVIVFSLSKGDLSGLFRNEATILHDPVPRRHIPEIVGAELKLIKSKADRVHAIVSSISSTEILKEFWNHDIPVIHLIHEYSSYIKPKSWFSDSLFYADAMVFSAEDTLINAIDFNPSVNHANTHVLPQGVCPVPKTESNPEKSIREWNELKSALRPKDWPDDTVVVLGAGSVNYRKGVDLFVACAKKVIEATPGKKIRFVWIGGGFDPENDVSYSCFLNDQIKKSGLGDSFSFIGDIEEFDAVYDLIDVFFLSSRLDPLPLVAQGALLHKVPLVCFEETGGIPRYLKEDSLVAQGIVPFLDVESAARKIAHLIENKELSHEMSESGYKLAKKTFDQDRYFSALRTIHDEIVAEKKIEVENREYIQRYNLIDAEFSNLKFRNNFNLAIKHYVRSWRRGYGRKPFPGFNPGIYLDYHKDCGDPLVHYHRTGCGDGPWNTEVITTTRQEYQDSSDDHCKIALHIHLHYPDVADEIFKRIQKSKKTPDLFITVTSGEGKKAVEKALESFVKLNHKLKIVPNRGRDIGPFFTGFPEIFDLGYDLIGHIHGKKSVTVGGDTGKIWAEFLFENLLGGHYPMMDLILERMIADPSLGLVFPDDPHAMGWNLNKKHALTLASSMKLTKELPETFLNFPVGTMFWARPEAIRPLIDLNLQWEDYPVEPLPYDGTMLHAIERLLSVVSENQGYRIAVTHVPGVTR